MVICLQCANFRKHAPVSSVQITDSNSFFFIYKINNQTNLSPNYSNFVDCEIHLLYINSTITECSSSFFFLVKKVIMKWIARTINIVRISYLLVTFISISISRVLQIVDHIGRFFSLLFKN